MNIQRQTWFVKNLLSLLLAATLAFGAALTCAAQEEKNDSFAVNAERLEWVKTYNFHAPCTFFILQNDTLSAMQPDVQFTVYSLEPDAETLTELTSGSTTQWICSEFTDADGEKHMVWTLPDMPADARCLRFAPGAFTDSSGNLLPEMCAAFKAEVKTYSSSPSSEALSKLQTVKTDAQLVEGETIAFPQGSAHMPASLFSVLAKTDAGESTISPAYDDDDNLIVPAAAGNVQYTLLFCGRPVCQTDTVYALSRTEYAELYKKDRPQSILKGIALILCLPVFILCGGLGYTAIDFIMSLAFTPTLVLLPFTVPASFVFGFGQGAATWWQTIRDLIGGK